MKRICFFSSPVTYCARWPSRARNLKISQKNTPSATRNQKPTSTPISQMMPSMSAAYVEACATKRSIMSSPSVRQDHEQERARDPRADQAHRHEERPRRVLIGLVLLV